MINLEHKKPAWLKKRLLKAIEEFNNSDDVRLLKDERTDEGKSHGSVAERTIMHRLAVHLEREFQAHGYPNKDAKIAVDCEYNRHRGAIKAHLVKDDLRRRVEAAKEQVLKEHPEKKGWYVFTISPDIIVHERGEDFHNLLVVEVKRASNTIDDELDNVKLGLFVAQDYQDGYGYSLGASVIASDDDELGERLLKPGRFFTELEK